MVRKAAQDNDLQMILLSLSCTTAIQSGRLTSTRQLIMYTKRMYHKDEIVCAYQRALSVLPDMNSWTINRLEVMLSGVWGSIHPTPLNCTMCLQRTNLLQHPACACFHKIKYNVHAFQLMMS